MKAEHEHEHEHGDEHANENGDEHANENADGHVYGESVLSLVEKCSRASALAMAEYTAYSLVVSTPAKSAPVSLSVRLARSGILAAAVGVFARHGVAATRVEDLLEAAGVARRTFYKYFRSKDEVLAGLYELATEEILKAIREAEAASGDPLEGVKRGIDVYFDYHAGNATLLKLLEEQSIRSDSELAPLRRRFRGELVAFLARVTGPEIDPLQHVALLSALEGVSLEVLEHGAQPADIARAKTVIHDLAAQLLAPQRHRAARSK